MKVPSWKWRSYALPRFLSILFIALVQVLREELNIEETSCAAAWIWDPNILCTKGFEVTHFYIQSPPLHLLILYLIRRVKGGNKLDSFLGFSLTKRILLMFWLGFVHDEDLRNNGFNNHLLDPKNLKDKVSMSFKSLVFRLWEFIGTRLCKCTVVHLFMLKLFFLNWKVSLN